MRIIIALDIIGGHCVRLTKGDYSTKKTYSHNPLDVAKQIEDHGFQYIHIVDLDGAREKRVINYHVVEEIASKTSMKIEFGGGIRSDDDLSIAFNSGADQVICGSIAATNPPLFMEWLAKWGQERIILGADGSHRKVSTEGWQENSGMDLISFITGYSLKGVKYVICTDIEKDGMLEGPSFDLYDEIISACEGISLIASGGISSANDILRLAEKGCEGAIIGKAIYEGILSLNKIKKLC